MDALSDDVLGAIVAAVIADYIDFWRVCATGRRMRTLAQSTGVYADIAASSALPPDARRELIRLLSRARGVDTVRKIEIVDGGGTVESSVRLTLADCAYVNGVPCANARRTLSLTCNICADERRLLVELLEHRLRAVAAPGCRIAWTRDRGLVVA